MRSTSATVRRRDGYARTAPTRTRFSMASTVRPSALLLLLAAGASAFTTPPNKFVGHRPPIAIVATKACATACGARPVVLLPPAAVAHRRRAPALTLSVTQYCIHICSTSKHATRALSRLHSSQIKMRTSIDQFSKPPNRTHS